MRDQRIDDDGPIPRTVRTDRYVTGFRKRHGNIGHLHNHGDPGNQEEEYALKSPSKRSYTNLSGTHHWKQTSRTHAETAVASIGCRSGDVHAAGWVKIPRPHDEWATV